MWLKNIIMENYKDKKKIVNKLGKSSYKSEESEI